MKKHKKLIKFLITAVIIITIIGGGFLYYFKDLIFNKPQDSELGEYYGLFGYAPIAGEGTLYIDYSDKFTEFAAQIEAGMQENASDEQKALAAYIIYRIGCLADSTSLLKAKYSTGSGSATGAVNLGDTTIDVSGAMNMTANYYDIKYPLTIPSSVDVIYSSSYQTYGVSEEYTQIPSGGVSGSNENIITLGEPSLRMLLPFARRTLYTPDYKVVWTGDQSKCIITPTSATAEFSTKDKYFVKRIQTEITAENEAAGILRDYDGTWGDIYGLTAHDISIHIINPSTILGNTVVISKRTGKNIDGDDIDYYAADFEIDTVSNRGTLNSATYYAEQLYQSEAPEAFMNYLEGYYLNYTNLKINMSVFTNGYMRTWSTVEQWVMGGNVKQIASAELVSDNDSTEAYCYDYNTIMQGFVNRYYGSMSQINMPITALPFYLSDLSGYTAEAYGTYR